MVQTLSYGRPEPRQTVSRKQSTVFINSYDPISVVGYGTHAHCMDKYGRA